MKPWETLGNAVMPGSGEKVQLSRRDTEYSITVDGYEIINNRVHGSKEILAELACDVIQKCQEPKILIAGLGMGYTLASTLKHSIPEADITVAEILPEVVEWNRHYFGELNNHALDDKRVTVKEIDVAELIKDQERAYNAIILDLDFGPQELIRESNSWLYSNEGLKAMFIALRSSGVLAVWGLNRKGLFNRRLNFIGFEVSEKAAKARGKDGGAKHNVWLAKKPRRTKKHTTPNPA